MASEAWDERCQRTVLGVLAKRGWQLVQDEKTFASQACLEIQQRRLEDSDKERVALERAAVRHYCIILHAACREVGSPRQRRAFEELWQYLFPIAVHKTHDADLAQDFTQRALVKVWEKISQCRDPGSFLNWVALILINDIREDYRGKQRREKALGEPEGGEPEITESDLNTAGAEEGSEINPLGSVQGDEGLEHAMRDESEQQLRALIVKCIKNPLQRKILVESLLNDKGYKEIAEELAISVGNVHVARHRALMALRKCRDLDRFIEDQLK